jgi:hypothetical protein
MTSLSSSRLIWPMVILMAISAGLLACSGSEPPEHQVVCSPDMAGVDAADVVAVAGEISADVGQMVGSDEGVPPKTVLVFDETHISRAGQIEIAVMLLRLHDRHGLRNIALEGALESQGTLDADWFHSLPERTRQDVAIEVLKEGEISGAEFMALVFPDIGVHGIEKKAEYEVEPNPDLVGSAATYLVAIAELSMTQGQMETFERLLDEDKVDEAVEYVVSIDPWTKERYEMLTSDTNLSIEDLLAMYDEVEQKAGEVGADVEPYREGFDDIRRFYETASKRSATMVDNTLALMEECPNTPMALSIGAGHTEKVMALLEDQGVSYAAVRQLSLIDVPAAGELSDEAYDRKLERLSVDGEGQLGRILDGQRKPRTVLDRVEFRAKLDAYTAAVMMATGAATGESPPFAPEEELALLEHISVDLDSVELDDDEVIFSFDAGGNKIWVRATALGPAEEATLEQRLMHALEDVKKGPDAVGLDVKRTSPNTIALFSADQDVIRSQRLREV